VNERRAAARRCPQFKFNEALSLIVRCDTQAEIDHYWTKLGAGGDPNAQVCGWLKDEYGVSRQIVPRKLDEWISDADAEKCERVMAAVFGMTKLDMAELERAHAGR
jgi:predicted 3-demethylubiquinone-9 3-methyltransferase (glyoxalase superfamily)